MDIKLSEEPQVPEEAVEPRWPAAYAAHRIKGQPAGPFLFKGAQTLPDNTDPEVLETEIYVPESTRDEVERERNQERQRIREALLSDEVVDAIAEERAIEELYGHWDDFPAKEANQRARYAQLAKKPGVQESWKEGVRRDAERFLAALVDSKEVVGDG